MESNLIVTEWQNIMGYIDVDVPPTINSPGKDEIGDFEKIIPKGLQYLALTKKKKHIIPEEILVKYREFGRPTPLTRALNLEKYLDTPARIFLKREDIIPTGSFKLNTALAQAFFAKKEGYKGVVTETGAGQWGLAISAACAIYDLQCTIFMARCSFEQKPLRRQLMELYGSKVHASPSKHTESGRRLANDKKFHHGSIGTAISEAVQYATNNMEFAYVAGSNMPFVYLHQSIMGIETIRQLRNLDEKPDTIIACVGGGSNLAGFALPFRYSDDHFNGDFRIIGSESAIIPRMTKGEYRYDHSDPAGLTPLVKSYTLGKDFTPPPTHIGGLRQHNGSPIIGALLKNDKFIARAYGEKEVFQSGQLLARMEGIICAPESCHSICAVIEEAKLAKESGRAETIVSCVSGSGILDFSGYLKHIAAC